MFPAFKGSGSWFGNVPSGSRYSPTRSQPSAAISSGIRTPATPLPVSTTIFRRGMSFTNDRSHCLYSGQMSTCSTDPITSAAAGAGSAAATSFSISLMPVS